MPTFKRFEDILAWQKARQLAKEVYLISSEGEFARDFELRNQLRRSTLSIMANIAEGQGRQHTKEFLNFLSVARGSLMELETHLILCQRIGLLELESLDCLLILTAEISRMMSGLRRTLEARL